MTSNKNLYWILALLSIAGYGWIGLHLLGSGFGEASFTACLFRSATGIPCPSCGITRSLVLLIQGDIPGAWGMNPLGLVAAPALLTLPWWITADTLLRKKTLERTLLWMEKKVKSEKTLYIPLVALALVNWGWNILKGL